MSSSFPTPPRFLENPGEPVAPFKVWFGLLENYIYMLNRNRKADDKLSDEDKNHYVFSLLGMEGCRLFSSNPVAFKQAATSYSDYCAAVKKQFEKPVNTVRAHVDFFQRKQGQSETSSEFLSSLRTMASDCDFGDKEDKFLAIQLVNGCFCPQTRVKLLEETTPDLDKVFAILQAAEVASQTDSHLRSHDSFQVSAVQTRKPSYSKASGHPNSSKLPERKQQQNAGTHICYGCGRNDHPFKDSKCYAHDKACNYCGNVGHLEKMCKTKQRKEGPPKSQKKPIRCVTVNTIRSRSLQKFYTSVKISRISDNRPVSLDLMVDSGSDVTAIPLRVYRKHFSGHPLVPVRDPVENYNGQPIQCYGKFMSKLNIADKWVDGSIWVLPNNCSPILGIPEIRASELDLFPAKTTCGITAMASSFEEILKDYPNLVAPGIGTFPDYKHKIQLRPDAIPCAYKCRPVPVHKLAKTKAAVDAMVEEGIWSPIEKADWAHPMVAVDKPDGDVRVTTDLRGLNKYVVPNRYPLPRIKDLFQKVQGSTVFTTIDLKKAYHTIALDEESRALTATITPWGLYAYNKLPMGLMDSGNDFQQRVSETLDQPKHAEDYVDDCVVHSANPCDHEKHVRDVLSKLNAKDFRINPKKCNYAQAEVPYLGFLLSKDGVRPNPKKLEAISEFPAPTSIPETRRFLGMANTYRHFVPSFATLAEPIQALLRKDQSFQWSPKCQEAFEAIKKKICNAACNAIFDRTAPTFVTTDASGCGLGAVLSQIQNGQEVPIEFASHTLEGHERSYAANELEAYACVWGCEHWADFLLGVHFTLRTDCQALTSMLNPSRPSSAKYKLNKFQRWVDRLSMFSYSVQHHKGTRNTVADALSRAPVKSTGEAVTDPLRVSLLTRNADMGISLLAIRNATKHDPVLQKVNDYARTGWPNKAKLPPELHAYYPIRNEIACDDGFLTRAHGRIILPASLVDNVLQQAHKGHPGIVRMKKKLRETYWWPKFTASIEAKVQHCGPCQASAKTDSNPPKINASLPESSEPWDLVSIDITGPFQIAPERHRFVVVLIDHYSGYPEVTSMNVITSTAISTWLTEVFSRHGCPSVLLSDNGPQFVSEEFHSFLSAHGIQHLRTPVYTPQSNGKVEVFNRYIKHGLQATSPGMTFVSALLDLLASYRATASSSNGKSPSELFLGRRMRLAFEPNRHVFERSDIVVQRQEKNLQPSTGPRRHLLRRGPFKVGDKVMSRKPQIMKGQSPWTTPTQISEVLGNYTYRLANGSVWSARKLKRYYPPENAPTYSELTATTPVRSSGRRTKGIPPRRYQAGAI